ncbi:MAG TPA: YafY family protein [Caulobacteraceae bacterium]|jgi:predicted DNA-binding transcriptional regulator YafY|nr:YafY family protein [Caulobacteraceae bacterium]
MRASRLLSILITLQLHGRASARELAERFEVSRRTIFRDVDELSAAGVPIYAERGAAGGFALLDGWRTQLTGMTPGEAEALAFTGLPKTAADLGLGAEAMAAHLKLLAALPSTTSEAARRTADRFHLDPTPWHRRPSTSPVLRTLAQAVWETRRVRVEYESWDKVSVRVLEPLGVVLKGGEWYFVALRRGHPAIHRLDKVKALTLLDETFKRPRRFDLGAAWGDAVESFEASLRRDRAVLRAQPEAMSRLDRLGADMAQPLRAATPDANGVREAEVVIESVGYAASLILGFGAAIEVVSPPALRDEIVERAKSVAKLYASRRR